MITRANISDSTVAAQVYAVQQAAYAVEARILGCTDFPPLRERLETLQQSRDVFLIFTRAGRVIGALSYEFLGSCVTINRLIVSPDHFRQGIASALLQSLQDQLPAGTVMCVSTAQLNHAAIKLYDKHGFTTTSIAAMPESIMLVLLSKILYIEGNWLSDLDLIGPQGTA